MCVRKSLPVDSKIFYHQCLRHGRYMYYTVIIIIHVYYKDWLFIKIKFHCHRCKYHCGSFGLRDQCSTDWAKGENLQTSQYQATGSYKHLWHIPPPWGISSSRLEVQSHFCKFDKKYFATQRNTESTLERHCHRCKYHCEKLYCTHQDSNSGPLVCETSALPIELKGIHYSRVSIKQLVRTNTCDIIIIFT